MTAINVGSVCSGIEAASVAWEALGFRFEWFSETAAFPSQILREKHPRIPNLGDMNDIPVLLKHQKIPAPDIICGGTPCQAFSLAGLKHGLKDHRGNLTMTFVDIADENDAARAPKGLNPGIVFWENVEGVLTDKTNAFGCLVSSLAGLDEIIYLSRWPTAGIIRGKKRNVAWRVLDAKFFGVPQQRRRLYLLAGGKEFAPDVVLFERRTAAFPDYPKSDLTFSKDGHMFDVFREYTDCIYSSYGTKWNGNAAAYNGSLYIVQDNRIRRLSPLECERLMGFPDNYTDIANASLTNRYQAIGNSWAVPVIKWIGTRLTDYLCGKLLPFDFEDCFGSDIITVFGNGVNASPQPEKCSFGNMTDIVSADAPESIYISPVGCYGIVRRKLERKLKMNPRLEKVLIEISSLWNAEEIETRSRIQKRGRFSESEYLQLSFIA
ncbi:MAG: DNA cytosine methyltransferase [Chitinispirillales bacterium]|jgi:DNA (cytosine-5)-methyltransferase 1|nr:DNA cytosine methyltransferase [Chitinispirillales bacterium]